MTKIINTLAVIWAAVKSYPHGVALALNLGVVLAAKFGFHVTTGELVVIATVASAAATAYTHKAMVPKSNLTGS